MLKYYCKSCGQGTEYSSKTPMFCGHCGQPFVNKTVAKTSTAPTPTPQPAILELDEDDEEDNDEPIVEGVALDIDVEVVAPQRKKSTLGDVLMSGVTSGRQELPSRQGPKVSQKKFLEEFAREAGAIKPQNRVRGKKK